MTIQIVSSRLDQLVSAYNRRFSYGREQGESEYHLVTGFVRAIAINEHGHLRLMIETVYTDGFELGEKVVAGDIVSISSNVDGVFRLSRTHHPFAATQAPGFPKPPEPATTPACDHAIIDQSLHVIPVELHRMEGAAHSRFMTIKWCGRCGGLWQGFGHNAEIADSTGEWVMPGAEAKRG